MPHSCERPFETLHTQLVVGFHAGMINQVADGVSTNDGIRTCHGQSLNEQTWHFLLNWKSKRVHHLWTLFDSFDWTLLEMEPPTRNSSEHNVHPAHIQHVVVGPRLRSLAKTVLCFQKAMICRERNSWGPNFENDPTVIGLATEGIHMFFGLAHNLVFGFVLHLSLILAVLLGIISLSNWNKYD